MNLIGDATLSGVTLLSDHLGTLLCDHHGTLLSDPTLLGACVPYVEVVAPYMEAAMPLYPYMEVAVP